jgi:hypothetical protein
MKNRWSVSISFAAFLSMGVASIPAWSLDMSVERNAYTLTPMSQIQSGTWPSASQVTPTSLNGNSGLSSMMMLNETPSDHGTSFQSASPEKNISLPITPPPVMSNVKPLPTFIILPVVTHTAKDKAFADLPAMLSSAVANQLSEKMGRNGSTFSVMNPVYAYDEVREKGLDGLYEKIIHDYVEAGQPNEKDVAFLTDQLSTRTQQIDWIVFVEAEFDTNHSEKPSLLEMPMALFYDRLPKDSNYGVKGKVEVFSTQGNMPLVWAHSSNSSIKGKSFYNFTGSILDDSDSITTFKDVTAKLAHSMVGGMPQDLYISQSSIKGNLVKDTGDAPANITQQDQENLKTILKD